MELSIMAAGEELKRYAANKSYAGIHWPESWYSQFYIYKKAN